ncbi:MAG: phosphoribosylaminoimidazolesuccinocarboxamide synthase [Bacillota bacterium]
MKKKIYEGKAKIVYELLDQPDRVLIQYKDDATAFDGTKRGQIQGKGQVNNQVSAIAFELLESQGISTHFLYLVSDTEMVCKRVAIIPVEVVVRNIVAGSLAKRLGIEEGLELHEPVLEFYYKSDELHDPMVNTYHIRAMKLASDEEMSTIENMALRVNQVLQPFLLDKGLLLVDFKLEFGRYGDSVILADEISPDTCRFWDTKTRQKLDKDRFRRDLGGVEEAYQEVLRRLTGREGHAS